jgi:alpha-beta hydrolase superfamily lysophospholipase
MKLSDKYEFIAVPGKDRADSVSIVIPGMSGGISTGKYADLDAALISKGIAVLHLQGWSDRADLDRRTLEELINGVHEAVLSLREAGYKNIMAIGKSFGGGLLCLACEPLISKYVLWAPTLFLKEAGEQSDLSLTQPLSDLRSIQELSMSKEKLAKIQSPILILHGSNDKTIPFENSIILQRALPAAILEPIPGMEHSPNTEKERALLVDLTARFLKESAP